jgi:hypothetical protein
MTDRAKALAALGYTDNQALFLELAALQTGYFLRKQFNDFLGRQCGALAQVFIERSLEKGHIATLENFGTRRIYHAVGHGLFRALGDENNRNRRSHQPATIRRRLMALDYCLAVKHTDWLLTERDKREFFKSKGVAEDELPFEMFGATKRFFVDKQPLAVGLGKSPMLVFVDEGLRSLSQWEMFLRAHRLLVQRLGQATVVFAGTQPGRFVAAENMFRRIVSGASASGSLDPSRLKRYFEARKHFEARQYSSFDQLRLDQLREDRKVFVGERIEGFYAGWIASGDSVLPPVATVGVSLETHLLKHRYEWISPIHGEERRECDALNSVADKEGTRSGNGQAR